MTSEAIPITRAQYYVPDIEAWLPRGARVQTLRDDGGIVELALDHLTVDHGCVRLGAVTVAAGGPDPTDAFGYEFDLEPEAARRLAAESRRRRPCGRRQHRGTGRRSRLRYS